MVKKNQMTCAVNFFELENFDIRFGISIPKDIEMSGVAISLPKKMVITTRRTVATARGTKLKPEHFALRS